MGLSRVLDRGKILATHLVTGGSGFLGNLIARRLLEGGERVRVLDLWRDKTQPTEIEYIESDIRDVEKVNMAMKGIDFVHHNVALVPLTKSGKNFWEVNVEGSRIAAESALRNGVQRFVHMSSSAIYGAPSELPITRTTPTHPIEIYGRGKLAGENAVKEVFSGTSTNVVVIRPRTILGPGRLGIFQILFQWISEGRNVYTIGSGNNPFQFIHAHDLMDAYMIAIQQKKSVDFNVGTENFGTLKQALENLIQFAASDSKVRSLPVFPSVNALRIADFMQISPLAPWHYLTYHKPFYFDLSPLKDLGWRSAYSNDQMLSEAYEKFLMPEKLIYDSRSPHRKPLSGGLLNLLKRFS